MLTDEKQAIKVLATMLNDREISIEYVDREYSKKFDYVIKGKITPLEDQNTFGLILCFIHDEEKLNIQGIKDKLSIMKKESAESAIIVYKNSMTASARKSLGTIDHKIEIFGMCELQVNITQHRLFPKHEKVPKNDALELENKYKGKLPVLLSTDAASRYYDFKRGEYIRITRKDGSIIYRIVK